MTVLGHILLEQLIKREGLIKDYININIQLQPAGFELTLRKVFKFKSPGILDFDNSKRKISDVEEIPFNSQGYVDLKPGTYKVVFNEIVKVPRDMIAIALPRSSLLRSGATILTAVWDPGYEGRSEALLVVFNPHGIRLFKNARLIQLIFIKASGVTRGYRGIYQYENINV